MYHRSSSVLWVRFPSDLLCDIPLLLGHLTNYSQTAVKFHLCLSQWQWLLIGKCKKIRTKAIGSTVTAPLESYTFPFTFRRVDQYMNMCADNLHLSKCICTNILRDLLTHPDVAILSQVSWNHIKEFNLLTHTYIIITGEIRVCSFALITSPFACTCSVCNSIVVASRRHLRPSKILVCTSCI